MPKHVQFRGNMSPILALWSPVVCIDPQSTHLTLILDFFWYWIYFFQLQNPATPRSMLSFAHCPSLFQRRRWVSLWTHNSTVTRSTSRLSTGEWCDCVEVNTVCCCLLDAFWTVVSDLVHKRSLCEWLQYQNVRQKEEGLFVMYRAGNWLIHR
jgi:hypothetical protein